MTETDVVITFTSKATDEQIELTKEFANKMENLGFNVTIGAPPPRPTR